MITKKEYVKNLNTMLDELNTGIEKMEEESRSVKENIKVKLQARIKILQEKRDSVFSMVQELKGSTENTWQDLKKGTENHVNSLKTALSKTKAHFKKVKE